MILLGLYSLSGHQSRKLGFPLPGGPQHAGYTTVNIAPISG